MFVDNFTFMQRREAAEFEEHAEPSDDITEWELRRYRAVM